MRHTIPRTARQRYWRSNLRLIAVLMLIGCAVTYGVIFFAVPLSHLKIFGWPVSFYMSAQGSLLIYVVIVWVYAHGMRGLDERLQRELAIEQAQGNPVPSRFSSGNAV